MCAPRYQPASRKLAVILHRMWIDGSDFRASATLARFKPRRCASLIAQLFRLDHLADRVSMTWAASNSATRTEGWPARLMLPTLSVSPDWYLRCVKPKEAPTDFDETNRSGFTASAVTTAA
jgi:hypothetical protein